MDWLSLFKKWCLEKARTFETDYFQVTDTLWGCNYFITHNAMPQSIKREIVQATEQTAERVYTLLAEPMFPAEIVGIARTGSVWDNPEDLYTHLKIKTPDGEIVFLEGRMVKSMLKGSVKSAELFFLKKYQGSQNVVLAIKVNGETQSVFTCRYVNYVSPIMEVNAN